jgi:hypothetical protein
LILAIVLRLRLQPQLQLQVQLQVQLQARRCSKKVSLASLARLLQSPNAVHALRAGSRSAAVLQCCTLIPTALCQAPAICPSPPSLACSSEDLKLPRLQSPYRGFGADRGCSLSKRIRPMELRGGGRPADHGSLAWQMALALCRHGHSSPPWKCPIAGMPPYIHYEKQLQHRPYLYRWTTSKSSEAQNSADLLL